MRNETSSERGRRWPRWLSLLVIAVVAASGGGCGASQPQPDDAELRADKRAARRLRQSAQSVEQDHDHGANPGYDAPRDPRAAPDGAQRPNAAPATPASPTPASPNATAAAGGTYPVEMSPAAIVGERSYERSEVQFSQDAVVRVDGTQVGHKGTKRTVRIEGLSQVNEVSPTGVALVMTFTVASATLEDDGGISDLVASGDVLTVRRKGPAPRIESSSGSLSASVLSALELVFTTNDPGLSNDEVFGTKQRRAIGDTWPVNSAAAAREMSTAGKMSVEARNVSGSTTLVAVEPCGKQRQCMTLHAEMAIDGFELPGLPPNATMRDSRSLIRIQQTHPLVPRSAPAQALMDMKIRTIVAMTQGDKEVEIETTIRSVQRASSEPR